MKRIVAMLLAGLLIFSTGCGEQTQQESSQGPESSQSPSQGETPPEEEEIPINPELAEYETLLAPMAKSGLMFSTWSVVEEMNADSLVKFYQYSTGAQGVVDALEVETFIASKFWGDYEAVRGSSYFNENAGTYTLPQEENGEEYQVASVLHALDTFVNVDKADGSGRASLQLSENQDTRYVLCVYNDFIPEEEDMYESKLVNRFLRDTTLTAVLQLFEIVDIVRMDVVEDISFASSGELSSDDLLKFYLIGFTRDNTKMIGSYSEQDGFYHLDPGEITAFLDKYLEGYTFDPAVVSWRGAGYVDGDVVLPPDGVAYISGTNRFTLAADPEIDGSYITLTAGCYPAGASEEAVSLYKLTLEITWDGYRIISLEVTDAPAE